MRIDRLKEEKEDLREVFKAILYFILAILTGFATITYKVLIKEIPFFMIIKSQIALIVAFLSSLYAFKI